MHSHLALEVESQPMALLPDTSVSVNDQNPLFNQSDMFTYPFEAPFDKNRQILKNMDDVNSNLRPTFFEKKSSRLIVEGLPLRSGRTVVEDASVLDNRFRFSLESQRQSFQDLITDMDCNEVPIPSNMEIVIGEMIDKVKVQAKGKSRLVGVTLSWWYSHELAVSTEFDEQVDGEFTLPALGFSYPAKCVVESASTQIARHDVRTYKHAPSGDRDVNIPQIDESYINVSTPYDYAHPYCNARACYIHRGYDSENNETTDSVTEDKTTFFEAHYPYWVLDATRPQSGICFYVAFFLECLFKHLGIVYDITALTNIPDFNRLAFFTTKCKYTTKPLHGTEQSPFYSGSATAMLGTEENPGLINQWFSSRGCGGRLSLSSEWREDIKDDTVEPMPFVTQWHKDTENLPSIDMDQTIVSANIVQMLATGENFPDVSVSELIESIENSFGARFIFDASSSSVKVVLLRDVFRNNKAPIPFLGEVLSMKKVVEKWSGFRMCYDSESDKKEQRENVKEGKTEYDTDYDYIDYPQDMTVYGSGIKFENFSKMLDPNDMHVYIDIYTGNAYRVKIDKEAKTVSEYHPVMFEVGGYKGVELGDCSETNSDNIYEMVSHFKPVIFNDVNSDGGTDGTGTVGTVGGILSDRAGMAWLTAVAEQFGMTVEEFLASLKESASETFNPYQVLSAYIDEDMEHEFSTQILKKSMTGEMSIFYLDMNLNLVESYDPTGTDDGSSPLQNIDWGLSVAMMRGGGPDAGFRYFDQNYDGFGNCKWSPVSGTYQMASDTMDSYGNTFDYNGEESDVIDQERFSLKIRAYKQPEWAEHPLCVEDAAVRQRGLFDTFMAEFAHFILNRKLYKIEALCTAAQLADIPNHWMDRYIIDGKVGYINKLNYSVSVESGIGKVEIEFYAL